MPGVCCCGRMASRGCAGGRLLSRQRIRRPNRILLQIAHSQKCQLVLPSKIEAHLHKRVQLEACLVQSPIQQDPACWIRLYIKQHAAVFSASERTQRSPGSWEQKLVRLLSKQMQMSNCDGSADGMSCCLQGMSLPQQHAICAMTCVPPLWGRRIV